MTKVTNVLKFYGLCNKLKDIIRTGWTSWDIERDRVESVADHVYSVQMLAIAIKSEYEYDIDLEKVILMLAIHELEEILIGDIEVVSSEHAKKEELGHKAIHKILSSLIDGEKLEQIILEFDKKESKEALFAYYCDKLECDLQAKLYDEQGCYIIEHQSKRSEYYADFVQEAVSNGAKSFSDIWLSYDAKIYENEENFKEIFEYAKNNNITELIEGE